MTDNLNEDQKQSVLDDLISGMSIPELKQAMSSIKSKLKRSTEDEKVRKLEKKRKSGTKTAKNVEKEEILDSDDEPMVDVKEKKRLKVSE